jgi:hypothetical protein
MLVCIMYNPSILFTVACNLCNVRIRQYYYRDTFFTQSLTAICEAPNGGYYLRYQPILRLLLVWFSAVLHSDTGLHTYFQNSLIPKALASRSNVDDSHGSVHRHAPLVYAEPGWGVLRPSRVHTKQRFPTCLITLQIMVILHLTPLRCLWINDVG